MENEERQRVPLDHQAALEQLEQFGRDIERYRAQRKAVGEQFETFIRSFETPPERPPIDITTPALPRQVPRAALSADPPPATQPPAGPGPSPVPNIPASEPVTLDAGHDREGIAAVAPVALLPPANLRAPVPEVNAPNVTRDAAPDLHASSIAPDAGALDPNTTVTVAPLPATLTRPRSAFSMPVVFGGIAIVVLAAGLLAMTLWNRAPESAPPATASPDTPVVTPEPAPAPPAAPSPAAAASQPTTGSALITIRRVWMRVTVDGARVLEREVPAGTTVPFNAEKTIVIRTGDAGAVKLSIRGEERGFLGAEGEVVTRSFTVPPRR